LTLPAIAPLAAFRSVLSHEHHFAYDHVIGTSLDLVVWTSDDATAERAESAVLAEIDRLASILNTRDPESEISRLNESGGRVESLEMAEVLSRYDYWTERTAGILSIRPRGPRTPRNVDALGKAYIIDRAASAASAAAPGIDGVLLNIGGDIVVRGRSCDIAITDPEAPDDNGDPITRIRLENAAIATSGTYARGAHLFDARTGQRAAWASSATVVARDAVTANALATTLCLMGADEGLQLVERTPGAAALHVGRNGVVGRSSGFSQLERPLAARAPALADWPAGYELALTLTLTQAASVRRPYVAVWIETPSGMLVRVLAFWANKPKYYVELSSFWSAGKGNQQLLHATARATRGPGRYQLAWDGLDEQHRPAPRGTYRVVVETNQEHGAYAKQAGAIECGTDPATLTLPATANFETVNIQYGPRTKPA